jgi:hypothetical protein
LELFQVAVVIVHGDMLKAMALMLGANILLVVAKDIGGLHPIILIEVFLRLISHSIVLQLQGSFYEHLSRHQFGVSTLRGHESIFFRI